MVTQTTICEACGHPLGGRLYHDSYLEIDLDAHRLKVKGHEVAIRPIPWKLLVCLIENRGKVVSPADLLTAVWGPEYCDRGLVNWQMGQLRKSLKGSGHEPPITTVIGWGLRYDG